MISELSSRVVMDFHGRAFSADGKPFYLVSGEFPYYRMDAALWADRLRRVREMGVRILSFYVPWRFHMLGPDEVDLSGASGDAKRDVKRFAGLAVAEGFSLIVKLGPFICAEYRRGGIPDWLMENHPETAMRDAEGRVVVFFEDGLALPDLLHPIVLGHVRTWYENAARDLLLPLESQGALAAVQVENEFPFSSMPLADPFSWGYNEHHRERFRAFREARFAGDGREIAGGCAPPSRGMQYRTQADWLLYRDWVEYKEDVGAEILSVCGGFLRSAGVAAPFYHDLIMLENESPAHFGKMARVMPVCPNFWFERHPAYDGESYARALVRAKLAASAQPGRVVYSSETNWSWGTEEEFSFLLHTLLPHLSGINLYCLVDGRDAGRAGSSPLSNVPEPYPGFAPIDAEGRAREAFLAARELMDFLGADEGGCGAALATAREETAVGLCNYTPYNHSYLLTKWAGRKESDLAALFPMVPAMNPWLIGMSSRLIERNFGFAIADLEDAPVEELRRYRLLFAPSFKYMDAQAQLKLIEYVEGGGVLFLSPELPVLDRDLQPCSLLRDRFFPGCEPSYLNTYANYDWRGFGNLGTLLAPYCVTGIAPAGEDVAVEAANWDGTPMALSARCGRGRIHWFGGRLHDLPRAADFLAWLCRENGIAAAARVAAKRAACAAEDVHVRTMRSEDSMFLSAVNRGGRSFSGSITVHGDAGLSVEIELPTRRGIIVWLAPGGVRAVLGTRSGARVKEVRMKGDRSWAVSCKTGRH